MNAPAEQVANPRGVAERCVTVGAWSAGLGAVSLFVAAPVDFVLTFLSAYAAMDGDVGVPADPALIRPAQAALWYAAVAGVAAMIGPLLLPATDRGLTGRRVLCAVAATGIASILVALFGFVHATSVMNGTGS